jgi:hypothetical protein
MLTVKELEEKIAQVERDLASQDKIAAIDVLTLYKEYLEFELDALKRNERPNR